MIGIDRRMISGILQTTKGDRMKLAIYASIWICTIAILASILGVYYIGVEHGRLQGLQCGTDTECEVLADMLDRAR